jgi:hypothetical protein
MDYHLDGYKLQAHVDYYQEERKKFIETGEPVRPKQKAKILDPNFEYRNSAMRIDWERYKEMIKQEKAA